MKFIGALVALNGIAIAGWYISSENPQKSWAIAICLIATFFGVFLMLRNRVSK